MSPTPDDATPPPVPSGRWDRLLHARLSAMVAAGQLEVVGVDAAGRTLYQAVPDA